MFKKVKKAIIKTSLVSSLKWFALGLALLIPLVLFYVNFKPGRPIRYDNVRGGNKSCIEFTVCAGPFAKTDVWVTFSDMGFRTQSPKKTASLMYLVSVDIEDKPYRMLLGVEAGKNVPFRNRRFEKSLKSGEPLKYYGTFYSDLEMYGYMCEYLEKYDFTKEDINEYAFKNMFYINGRIPYIRIASALLGLAAILYGLFQMILAAKGDNFYRFEKDVANTLCSEDELADEFMAAETFDNRGQLKIGRKHTFIDIYGKHPRIIAGTRIDAVKTRIRGGNQPKIPVRVEYLFEGEDKPYKIKVSSNCQLIDRMFQEYKKKYPDINYGVLERKKEVFHG